MPTTDQNRPQLSLIPGGRHRSYTLNNVTIIPAPDSDPPFAVDAVVLEEDTYLITSTDKSVRFPHEHPVKIFSAALEQQPTPLGSVLVRKGVPLRLLAVVHDFNNDPSWKSEGIATAHDNLFEVAADRLIKKFSLPLFGHPSNVGTTLAALDRFLAACRRRASSSFSVQVWLVVPSGFRSEVAERLSSLSVI